MTLIQELQTYPPFFIALSCLLGLLVGSFLNVVIYRLPKMMERDWKSQCTELSGGEPVLEAPYNLYTPGSAW